MLKEAWNLLELQFNNCLKVVQDDEFYRGYALAKWRHSKQVAGAGNYIIPKIKWLQNKSEQYVDMVRCAVLLHDVCRFTEAVRLFKNSGKYDHGEGGAELLKNTALFNDVRIWLPIKHHGHLIESLYEDSVYQNLNDEDLKDEVKKICFIIRDADKIANLHMMVNEDDVLPLFLGKSSGDTMKDYSVSQIVRDNAFKEETTPRFAGATIADHAIGYLSWFMDINYRYSVEYCEKLGVIDRLFKIFEENCSDEDFKQQYSAFVKKYIQEHEFMA